MTLSRSHFESVHPSSSSCCFLMLPTQPSLLVVTRDRESSRRTLSFHVPCRKNFLLNISSVVCPKESKVEASNFKPHAAILAPDDVTQSCLTTTLYFCWSLFPTMHLFLSARQPSGHAIWHLLNMFLETSVKILALFHVLIERCSLFWPP